MGIVFGLDEWVWTQGLIFCTWMNLEPVSKLEFILSEL